MQPPVAAKRPHMLKKHGDVRLDDYYWLRERDNPDVTAYLEAENTYLRECTRHTAQIERRLFDEIKARIKQTDVSVPYREGDFLYYWRYEDEREYRIYCRTPIDGDDEEVVLDVNTVAEGHEFCDVSGRRVSPSQQTLAYVVDTIGRRQYAIRFRDLVSGTELSDVIPDVTSNVAWANDSQTLFYARQDPTTLRSYQIFRHRLGCDTAEDELVYEETDETFSCTVGNSRSKRYLLIASFQTVSTEYRYLDADDPTGQFTVFLPRAREHEYELEHFRGRFYILTNAGAKNFRLLETDETRPERRHWCEVIPHRDDVLLENFEMFRDHLVVVERHEGLTRLRIHPWRGDRDHHVDFDEPAYHAYTETNRESETHVLRFGYSSLTTPVSIYDYDMVTRQRVLLKRDEVLGDFDPSHYQSERIHATASDGTLVPISLVFRRGIERDGTNPLLLHGYGSYGISTEATFRSSLLSLLDRGFTFAIAHVRGGEELGRRWYEDGKLLKKTNTFTDFIACAEHLIAECYTASDRLYAIGGSAGGLLMGAIINMRPDLFHGVVSDVPFVDVVTTMLDQSIPLTTGEYDEWGNPNEKHYYAYMRSYSPYDNVTATPRPHLLVMTGFHDSQVQYWEPAKWVAKLRACKVDDRRLLLRTNMEAGHGGASGRYKQYRDTALQYAFLLDLAGFSR